MLGGRFGRKGQWNIKIVSRNCRSAEIRAKWSFIRRIHEVAQSVGRLHRRQSPRYRR